MPVRLTLLLLGALILFLLIFGNPQPVRLQLLFWTGTFSLYKVIIGSIGFGVILTVVFLGHVKHLRRLGRDRPRLDAPRGMRDSRR